MSITEATQKEVLKVEREIFSRIMGIAERRGIPPFYIVYETIGRYPSEIIPRLRTIREDYRNKCRNYKK